MLPITTLKGVYNMKKLSIFLVTLALGTVLVACGGGETEQKTFTMDKENTKTEIEYTYNDKNDQVASQQMKSELTYEYLEFADEEEAKAELEPSLDEFNDIKGVTYELDFKDESVVETTTIDFNTLDFDDADKIPGFSFDGDPTDGISMEETTKSLKATGFSEK